MLALEHTHRDGDSLCLRRADSAVLRVELILVVHGFGLPTFDIIPGGTLRAPFVGVQRRVLGEVVELVGGRRRERGGGASGFRVAIPVVGIEGHGAVFGLVGGDVGAHRVIGVVHLVLHAILQAHAVEHSDGIRLIRLERGAAVFRLDRVVAQRDELSGDLHLHGVACTVLTRRDLHDEVRQIGVGIDGIARDFAGELEGAVLLTLARERLVREHHGHGIAFDGHPIA